MCERYSFLLCKFGRTSDKTCSLKSMALQMPSYSKYACNIVQIGGPAFYATCLCSPIYIFLCTVFVTLPRLGQISYHFDDSRTLQYTQILICYVDDQPFLVGSTPFLSQCNRMTRTQLHL